MIVPDVNLLVYAYNADTRYHLSAKSWLERNLTDGVPFGLPWAVALGFIRIMTDGRILEDPMTPSEAVGHVQSWLECAGVSILEPGHRHLEVMAKLFDDIQVGKSLPLILTLRLWPSNTMLKFTPMIVILIALKVCVGIIP